MHPAYGSTRERACCLVAMKGRQKGGGEAWKKGREGGESHVKLGGTYYSVRWHFLTSQVTQIYSGLSFLKTQPFFVKQSAIGSHSTVE